MTVLNNSEMVQLECVIVNYTTKSLKERKFWQSNI